MTKRGTFPTAAIIARMTPEQRREFGLRTPAEAAAICEAKSEREFAENFERWLLARGYMPRTEDAICNHKPGRGWWIHLHRPKRNAYVLDYIILANDNVHGFELELKSETGGYNGKAQEALCEKHGRPVYRRFEDATAAVEAWEATWAKVNARLDRKEEATQ